MKCADPQANSVKNLDTPEDKLGWMFDAFDADGGGTVDAEEITSIVVGLFRSGLRLRLFTEENCQDGRDRGGSGSSCCLCL